MSSLVRTQSAFLSRGFVRAHEEDNFYSRKCTYCWEPYDQGHVAARLLSCNHIYGKECLSVCLASLFPVEIYSYVLVYKLIRITSREVSTAPSAYYTKRSCLDLQHGQGGSNGSKTNSTFSSKTSP
jgi:hypothetical protein